MSFEIATLSAGAGVLGICRAPGRFGNYAADFDKITAFAPGVLVTMTEYPELDQIGASALPGDARARGVGWFHLPIRDFGTPTGDVLAAWPEASSSIRAELAEGGRVLVHCMGGCGRSGMAILRILCEQGEKPDHALGRLRKARSCAVETDDQLRWASEGYLG